MNFIKYYFFLLVMLFTSAAALDAQNKTSLEEGIDNLLEQLDSLEDDGTLRISSSFLQDVLGSSIELLDHIDLKDISIFIDSDEWSDLTEQIGSSFSMETQEELAELFLELEKEMEDLNVDLQLNLEELKLELEDLSIDFDENVKRELEDALKELKKERSKKSGSIRL